ncbi:MAG: T9SS C-terminal target domain-containing protein, partial [Candidatus Kapaibacterium sp.]
LAQTDPFGFTTTGIVRYSSTVGSWRVVNVGDGEDADPNMKRIARGWEPSKYLNIWVVEFDGFLGYARFPWQNRRLSDNTIIDGVTMDYRSFGDQDPYLFPDYDSGRILTHEVGHWLGLYHIFTDLVYDALQRRLVRPLFCGTDLVNDTPIQRHDTRSTRSSPTACLPAGTPYFSDLGSSCELFGIGQDSRGNMFMNYMDYSNFDDCFNMFTRGQVLRMRRTLLATVDEREAWWRQGSRRDMVMSNTNCSAPSFQVFLTSNNDFATENTTISCEATARNGSGPYTFEWQYRELAVGDTQWPTAWNVVANNSTNMFSIVMQNVQSIQVRVTAIDANGQRITTSIIIRNLDNTRLPARQAAQARRRAVAPVTAATISLTSATLSLGLQISPNPASDRVSVSYSLPANSVVQVELLNVLNQVLATPVAMTQQEQGKHSVDINLSALQTGTYFIRCTATLREGRIISEVMPLQIVR